jgi:plasmid stabilization system protein ParE
VAAVLVTPLARQDLSDIWDYVAENSVERADRLLNLIHEKLSHTGRLP